MEHVQEDRTENLTDHWFWSRSRETLVILAARLIRGLHPVQVDSLVDHQLFGVAHRFWGQEAWAPEDPGVVDVEQAEDVGAGIHDGQTGVVGGQNPVGAVGSNWEMTEKWSSWGLGGFWLCVIFIHKIDSCIRSGNWSLSQRRASEKCELSFWFPLSSRRHLPCLSFGLCCCTHTLLHSSALLTDSQRHSQFKIFVLLGLLCGKFTDTFILQKA